MIDDRQSLNLLSWFPIIIAQAIVTLWAFYAAPDYYYVRELLKISFLSFFLLLTLLVLIERQNILRIIPLFMRLMDFKYFSAHLLLVRFLQLASLVTVVSIPIFVGIDFNFDYFFIPDLLETSGSKDLKMYTAMAIMLDKLGTASTGLHGPISSQGYYVGAIYLIVGIARLLDCNVRSVLLFLNPFLLTPIFLTTIFLISRAISPISSNRDICHRWILLSIVTGGYLTAQIIGFGPSLPIIGVGPVSGSICLATILLMGHIGFLIKRIYTLSLLSLILVFLVKTPFGIAGLVILLGVLLFRALASKQVPIPELSIGFLASMFFVWWWFIYPESQVENSVTTYPFYGDGWSAGIPFELIGISKTFLYSVAIENLLELQKLGLVGKLVAMLMALFSVYWIYLWGVGITKQSPGTSLREYRAGLFVFALFAMVFMSLDFRDGMHWYLVAPLGYMSLPLVILTPFRVPSKGTYSTVLIVVILATGVVLTISNLSHFFVNAQNFSIERYESKALKVREELPPRWLQVNKLMRKVVRDESTIEFLIYIPPNDPYWEDCSPTRDLFNIPLFAERAALYGWRRCKYKGRYWGADNYYRWGQGYWWYPRYIFDKGQIIQDSETLCAETISLGYLGYLTFSEDNYVFNMCATEQE